MLTKEYRIPLPLSVEEYRIAQLYMIQKKSRQESSGAGSGVEILINRPYADGPGGQGQYTHKVYHIGSHLPSWFRAILPKTALRVEEESWNAYPYTKTRYTCPFVEKFSVEVETKYYPDAGHQENVFDLPSAEYKNRLIEFIDMVNDPISSSDYKKDEDPRLFVSTKTGRGPLTNDWVTVDANGGFVPVGHCTDIMCAYKLCKVEFRYWGMQNRIEKFIHDVALNKTMLHAHRQVWCWQDEWVGLTIDNIRQLEREAAKELREKMAEAHLDDDDDDDRDFTTNEIRGLEYQDTPSFPRSAAAAKAGSRLRQAQMDSVCSDYVTDDLTGSVATEMEDAVGMMNVSGSRRLSKKLSIESRASNNNSDMLAQWRMSSIQQDSDSSEDEFFDAQDVTEEEPPAMSQWSSLEAIHHVEGDTIQMPPLSAQTLGSAPTISDISVLILVLHGGNILDGMQESGAKTSDVNTFKIAFDVVVRAHFPIAVGRTAIRLVPCPSTCYEAMALMTSLSPCGRNAASETKLPSNNGEFIPLGALPILATSMPEYAELVSLTVSCMNRVYAEFMRSESGQGFVGQVSVVADCMGAMLGYDALCRGSIPFSSSSTTSSPANYSDAVSSPASSNDAGSTSPAVPPHRCASSSKCMERLGSESLDASSKRLSLSSSDLQALHDDVVLRSRSETSPSASQAERSRHFFSKEVPLSNDPPYAPGSMARSSSYDWRRASSCSQASSMITDYLHAPTYYRLDFEISQFFAFGSPLGIVLAHRRLQHEGKSDQFVIPPKPACHQFFNLFHRTDPSAARIEPLINQKFSLLSPCVIARYQKFPLGDGHSIALSDSIAGHTLLFMEGQPAYSSAANFTPSHRRLPSSASVCSEATDEETGGTSAALANVVSSIGARWWGSRRLDYALYCPEALQAFPTGALPHLFHASYWESTDVVAFILRQIFQNDCVSIHSGDGTSTTAFIPSNPREKWQRKRTSVKMKQNVNPNHRFTDVICLEGTPQTMMARFMYSSLDMVTLTGEKVDVHIVTQPPSGEWVFFSTEMTNSHGRLSYTIPETRSLSQGIYPVKMVVRGDHTSAEGYLAIVPPKCECIVFSIDGSFTASVSIMGRDPKVRAGAVDVVRHWQDLNYLIIYITARPSMQKQKVVAWLAQHNFPHGMVYFIDGLSTDPLRQKANYLRGLTEQTKMVIHAAYGSSKDIWVYSVIGLQASQIYIVGKVSKKYQSHAQSLQHRHSLGDILEKDATSFPTIQKRSSLTDIRQDDKCVILSGGYAAHLDALARNSRPAVGNSRLILRKGCFSLPGQSHGSGQRSSKQPASRTVSYGAVRTASGSLGGSFRSNSASTGNIKGGGGGTSTFSSSSGGSFKIPKAQSSVKFEI